MDHRNQWWSLPPEIVDLVLSNVLTTDFRNYYHLCGDPCKQVLNDPGHLATVLRSDYGADIEAFGWAVPEMTTEEFTTAFNKYNADVTYVAKSLFSFGCNQVKGAPTLEAFEALMRLVTRLSCSESNPIIAWLHQKMTDTETAEALATLKTDADSSFSMEVAIPAWSRHLQHMKQFAMCVRFFRDTDPNTRRDIERCHFELTRCRLEFDLCAHYRTRKLKQLREHVAKFRIYHTGRVLFSTTESYYGYLRSIIFTILRVMQPKPTVESENADLLRYYMGECFAPLEICYSVIAKILQEEIFDNMIFQTPDGILKNVTVKVSPQFVIVDDTYISVSQSDMSVSVYDKTQLQQANISPSVYKALQYLDVVRRMSHVDPEKPALDYSDKRKLKRNSWSLKNVTTCKERLRFMRTLLISVCSRKDLPVTMFNTLHPCYDFYLYHACARTLLGQDDYEGVDDFLFRAAKFLPSNSDRLKSKQTRLVLNPRWSYIGLRFGQKNEISPNANSVGSADVLPTDSLDVFQVGDAFLQPLKPGDFGKRLRKFINVLLRSEGTTVAMRYIRWNLLISKDFIAFSNTRSE